MAGTLIDSEETLTRALAALGDDRFGTGFYRYENITGGTQAAVWRGVPHSRADPETALRLTPKPLELIQRIATLVDGIEAVECPQTLGTASIEVDGRRLTVQVCTWIGSAGLPKSDMYRLGACLAALHDELQASSQDFSDRRLSFERARLPASGDPDQDLPPWYVARHLWRKQILVTLHLQAKILPAQPIHGDMHWENIVPTSGGFGFIDFDKVMWAPAVFDLAKLIATGFFEIGAKARLRLQRVTQLLDGYTTLRSLSEREADVLEGLALLLNEESARIGMVYDVEPYRQQAAAVGTWWIARRRRLGANPLGIRDLIDPAPPSLVGEHQLALWPDHDAPATGAG